MAHDNYKPLVYKQGDVITTSPCISRAAPLLLGAYYLGSRRNYLYWSSKPGTLLVGANNQVTESSNVSILSGVNNTVSKSTNSSLLGTKGVFLNNSTNTVVAGLDYTGLLPQIEQFDQSLITGNLITTKSVRIGSLIDQGSSVYPPVFCHQGVCMPYPEGGGCLCGEKDDGYQSVSCRSSEPPFVPILTTYGDAHIKGQLAVDNGLYSGPIYSTGAVVGRTGSFNQIRGGSFYGSVLDIAPETETMTITGTSFASYVTGAPLTKPLSIILDGTVNPFILGQTITFKDVTLGYRPGTPYSIFITCMPGVFMECRDLNGDLVRRDTGPYIIDTTGGSVTFVLRDRTWLITSEVTGNPRFQRQ